MADREVMENGRGLWRARGATAGLLALLVAGACDQQPPANPSATGRAPTGQSPTGQAPAGPGATGSTPAPKSAQPAPKNTEPAPEGTPLKIEKVTIAGRGFNLELAADDETRFRGLSNRAEIKGDGGMLFVFPSRGVHEQNFVMRDCPSTIDIIYLDTTGRITATYSMPPEAPRSEAEKVLTAPPGTPHPTTGWTQWPAWTHTNDAYENRLKKYSSRFPAQFVIELKGGTLQSLNLKPGQKIELDLDRLKKLAK